MAETNETTLDLDAIEARCDAAWSPAPWWNESGVVHANDPSLWTEANHACVHVANCMDPGDADFIAAARTDVPALAREVRRLRQGNGDLIAALRHIVRICDDPTALLLRQRCWRIAKRALDGEDGEALAVAEAQADA